jgi:hypothetical protein
VATASLPWGEPPDDNDDADNSTIVPFRRFLHAVSNAGHQGALLDSIVLSPQYAAKTDSPSVAYGLIEVKQLCKAALGSAYMDYTSFLDSLRLASPPSDLPLALQSLWYDFNGDWNEAHATIQNEQDLACARVHAYLHRKEGDTWNARHWYRVAGKRPMTGPFADEREQLAKELLEDLVDAITNNNHYDRRASLSG